MISLFREKFSANKREISFFFGGQAAGVILSFVLIKLIASAGAVVYGEYILITTLAALTGQLYYGPLQQGFIRSYFETDSTEPGSVYNRLISLFLYSGAVIFGILAFAAIQIVSLSGQAVYSSMILLALWFSISSKFSEFFSGILNAARLRVFNAIIQTSEKLVSVFLVFLLLVYHEMFSDTIIIALSIPLLVAGYIKSRRTGWRFSHKADFSLLKEKPTKDLLAYSLPFALWGAAMWLQLNGEKWVINAFLTAEDVGYYGLMFSLTNAFIAIPSNIINDLFLPLIFKNFSADGGDRKRGEFYIAMSVISVLLLTTAAFLLFTFAGEFLITLLSTAEYTRYSALLPWLAAGSGLFYAGQALCNKGLAHNRPHLYLFPKVISGLVSVILYYYFIQIYGMTGIIAASVITGLLYFFLVLIANRKLTA
ncbi:MAG: hypothetical protein AMXMBFR48_10220 [Ignavibacteriales bacterium]